MSKAIVPPYVQFLNTESDPLENGKIYIGEAGQNPETNPITVYFEEDLTLPAPQPLRTLAGRITYNGSFRNIHTDETEYSIVIKDQNDITIATELRARIGLPTEGLSAAKVKELYEANADTNAFTDANASSLNALSNYTQIFGRQSNQSVRNGDWNFIHDDALASRVQDGNRQQPNWIGWQTDYFQFKDFTDTRNQFVVDPGFDVDIDNDNFPLVLRVNRIDKSFGGNVPLLDSQYSVTKNGTELTITTNDSIDGNLFDVRIWPKGTLQDNAGNSGPLLNFIYGTYDAVTDNSGPQITINSTHSASIRCTGGHSTFLYGSYIFMLDGCDYSGAGGTNIVLTDLDAGGAYGSNIEAGGNSSFVYGSDVKMFSDNSYAFGRGHRLVTVSNTIFANSVMMGRGGEPRTGGMFVYGAAKSSDVRAGQRQTGRFSGSRLTTSASESFLSASTGNSLYVPGINSKTRVKVWASCHDGSDDNHANFDGEITLFRNGNSSRIEGVTALTKSGVVGTAANCSMRFQVASNGLYIRVTGEDGKEYKWFGEIEIIEHSYDAPA